MKIFRNWLLLAIIYGSFFLWYTDFGGKLDAKEIAMYTEKLQESSSLHINNLSWEEKRASEKSMQNIQQFMREDTGKQFLMVNNIDMSDSPGDVEGAQSGESASQLMDRYMEHMYPELFKRACHPVFAGNSVLQAVDIVGIENAEDWDAMALMRYKSRRAFMEIVSNPKMFGKHEFKIAALDKTIAYPIETVLYLSDPRLLLGLILLIIGLIVQLRVKK